jgi:hypothetical protein
LLALIRANARVRFSRPQTSSINCSPMAGLSVPRFAVSDSVHSPRPLGAQPACAGPFGPSTLSCLIRPLLTSAVRSGPVTRSSVRNPGPTADLPR